MKPLIICLTAVLLLGFWGCSTSQFGWEAEPDADQPAPKGDSGFIEDFDPLSLEEEDIQVTPLPKNEQPINNKVIQAVPDEADDLPESELVQGYRVQLSASTDEKNAFAAKRRAIYKFSQRVYLDFQAPYYKLYVGDFLENQKREANDLAEQAKKMGFNEAWATPARVNPKNAPKDF